MAFVFIPAHKRIVFMAGFDLAMTVFLHTVVRTFASWAVNTTFVQMAMKNMTEYANKTAAKKTSEGIPRLARLDGEL